MHAPFKPTNKASLLSHVEHACVEDVGHSLRGIQVHTVSKLSARNARSYLIADASLLSCVEHAIKDVGHSLKCQHLKRTHQKPEQRRALKISNFR